MESKEIIRLLSRATGTPEEWYTGKTETIMDHYAVAEIDMRYLSVAIPASGIFYAVNLQTGKVVPCYHGPGLDPVASDDPDAGFKPIKRDS